MQIHRKTAKFWAFQPGCGVWLVFAHSNNKHAERGHFERMTGGTKSASKYGNKKWELAGQTFDSQREARRYQELRFMLRMGWITDLQRQVPYELIPSQKRGGKVVERPVKYVADFVYTQDGETVVEDAKGVRTKEYIIKRKLMLYKYGIRVREV